MNKVFKNTNYQLFWVLSSCMVIYLIMWSFCGHWPWTENPYNSYVLQAKSWLEGRLDLGKDYSHLEIASFGGKYFVSFPPFPSVLLLPFVLLNIPDGFAALFFSLSGTVFAFKLCEKSHVFLPCFWALFLTLASNVLLVSINSWVWFIAQNMSFVFTLGAIYFAFTKKGALSFTLWAMAIGCRPFQIIYFPLLVMILTDNGKNMNFKKLFKQFLPAIVIGLCYMLYNYLRFNNVFEFGHNYLPEFLEAEKGQFHPSYILENLKSLVLLPTYKNGGALQFPHFNGMSVFLVFPILFFCVFCILKGIKKPRVWVGLICIVLHILVLTSHKTMGGWHFGNRYFIDTMPAFFYLLTISLPKESEKVCFVAFPFFLLGLGINLAGIITMLNG